VHLKAQNGVPDWNQVEALIKEWKPDAVVVGLPLNMDGTPSEMSARAEKFARRLNGRFNLPLLYPRRTPDHLRGQGRAPGPWRPERQLPRQPGRRHRRRPAAARLAGENNT
jgi:putative Holliday junction resolvase